MTDENPPAAPERSTDRPRKVWATPAMVAAYLTVAAAVLALLPAVYSNLPTLVRVVAPWTAPGPAAPSGRAETPPAGAGSGAVAPAPESGAPGTPSAEAGDHSQNKRTVQGTGNDNNNLGDQIDNSRVTSQDQAQGQDQTQNQDAQGGRAVANGGNSTSRATGGSAVAHGGRTDVHIYPAKDRNPDGGATPPPACRDPQSRTVVEVPAAPAVGDEFNATVKVLCPPAKNSMYLFVVELRRQGEHRTTNTYPKHVFDATFAFAASAETTQTRFYRVYQMPVQKTDQVADMMRQDLYWYTNDGRRADGLEPASKIAEVTPVP